jgi:hypothetical protein
MWLWLGWVRFHSVTISRAGLDSNFLQPFSEPWLAAFRQTAAFEQWDKSTDDAIFDICEPRLVSFLSNLC